MRLLGGEWDVILMLMNLIMCASANDRYTNLDPIGEEKWVDSMDKITRAVEDKIKNEMPDQFGLIIDGWSNASEHYLAVFGCYVADNTAKHPLLAMAPLVNEPGDDHSADTHARFLKDMLRRDYGKGIDNCLFIVADNCSVNKRLAQLMGVPQIGCASHRLNLAVQDYLPNHEGDLSAVQALMVKMRTLNSAAALR